MNDMQQSVGLRPEALLQILEVTRKLAAPFDLQSVLTEIGEAARSVLHAERATVWLYEPGLEALVLAGTPADQPVRARLEQGILGLTARTRAIVNVPDCRVDERFDPAVDLDQDNDVRCMLSVPLVEQNSLVGVLQVVDSANGHFTADDERVATTLASQCVVFIQRERLTRSVVLAEKLDREIKLARDIQMSTLPSDMPSVPGYDMAGQFCPADDTGGDTFDLVMLDDQRLFILLGDASGHGIGPALSSTQMTGMLRVALRLGADLDAIFTHVNNQLVEDLPEEHFVTAFLGMLDPRRHEVTYHAAGQGPLLHFRAATGECEWREPTTFPMGYMRYPSLDPPASIVLEPGDVLGLISDGAYERENATQAQFGTEGVERVVTLNHHRPMSELLTLLLEALHDFAGGVPQADDVTIVLLRRKAEASAATTVQRYFKRSYDSLEAVFQFIEDFLRVKSIDMNLREPVDFIVEELFTNMVKYNPGNEHDIALSLGCTAQVLTVRLTDFDVDPFDVTRGPAVDIDKPLQERQIGGLGLHLVRKMADTLRYEFADRRSTITFTMALG
jgi:phosphoserine phosphatase RsbU/P